MRRTIGFLLGVLLLGGCAVYAEPMPPSAGIYVAPPPAVVIAPRPGGDGAVGGTAVGGTTGGADGGEMKSSRRAQGAPGAPSAGRRDCQSTTTSPLCALALVSLTCTL